MTRNLFAKTVKALTLSASLTSALLISASPALSHEGHGHTGAAEPVHGGIIKEGKALNLEVLTQGKAFKIFPQTKDAKVFDMNLLKLKATAQPPKKSKVAIPLQIELDHAAGKFDAKGAHRYELVVEATTAGKTEVFKFQVEPKD